MNVDLSYSKIKTANEARVSEGLREEQRKKNVLILILQHLHEEGYLETGSSLEEESGISLKKYQACDNIDLLTILQEYEAFYYVKFSKYPKITRKVMSEEDGGTKGGLPPRPRRNDTKQGSNPLLPKIPNPPVAHRRLSVGSSCSTTSSGPSLSGHVKKKASSAGKVQEKRKETDCFDNKPVDLSSLNLAGTSIRQITTPINASSKGMVVNMREMLNSAVLGETQKALGDGRLMKPIAAFAGDDVETRELAAVISRDIYLENPDVRWNDIIGLGEAKRLVKEAVVYPIKYPQLFTGILSPWKGLLLYGPPGTGKTLLAKAVATECNTTFFNISASTIVSKWRGDSEKLVRVLFELARFHAPSTIFIDELESIMSQRGFSGSGEHEGSRRMKTELLVQMDGLAKSSEMVFLLAASNLPWELDHAMLRRLEKRILVDLPTCEVRQAMFQHHLPPKLPGALEMHTKLQYDILAKATEGYSGSDIHLLCKEAAMRPLRKVFDRLEGLQSVDDADITDYLKVDPVLQEDVEAALVHTKPSAQRLKHKYIEWQRDYESV